MNDITVIWLVLMAAFAIWMFTDAVQIAKEQRRRVNDDIVYPGLWVMAALIFGIFVLPVYIAKRSSWLRMSDDALLDRLTVGKERYVKANAKRDEQDF